MARIFAWNIISQKVNIYLRYGYIEILFAFINLLGPLDLTCTVTLCTDLYSHQVNDCDLVTNEL